MKKTYLLVERTLNSNRVQVSFSWFPLVLSLSFGRLVGTLGEKNSFVLFNIKRHWQYAHSLTYAACFFHSLSSWVSSRCVFVLIKKILYVGFFGFVRGKFNKADCSNIFISIFHLRDGTRFLCKILVFFVLRYSFFFCFQKNWYSWLLLA